MSRRTGQPLIHGRGEKMRKLLVLFIWLYKTAATMVVERRVGGALRERKIRLRRKRVYMVYEAPVFAARTHAQQTTSRAPFKPVRRPSPAFSRRKRH